jgi:general secretion pathway protein G
MRRHGAARARGFSLLELMVVVAILGLLASIAAVKYWGVLGESMQSKVQADFAVFGQAIDLYHLKKQKYPARLEDLVTARLMEKIPQDPWGHDYIYSSPAGARPYSITSLGSDGQQGGTGDAQDLTTENIDSVVAGR